MLGEFIKILSDEPEKLVKVIIRIYKVLLTGLFGIVLYRFFLHAPPDFDIGNNDKLVDFILKGKFIVFSLFYVISHFILFSIIASLFSYFAFWTAHKVSIKPSAIDLQLFLSSAGALSHDKKSQKVTTGRNFEVFHELLKEYGNEKGRQEITSLKGSYIDNIWSLGCVSSFVFLIAGSYANWSSGVLWLIFIVLILVLLIFWIIQGMFEFLNKNHRLLSFKFNGLKSYNIIRATIENNGIQIIDIKDHPWGVLTFNLNNKQYIFHLLFVEHEFLYENIKKYVDENRNKNLFFLFISNLPILGNMAPIDLLDFETVSYESEEDLEKKVQNFLTIHSRKSPQIK